MWLDGPGGQKALSEIVNITATEVAGLRSPKTFQSLYLNGPVPATMSNAVVAIGNFDGMHRGHQAVLDIATDKAIELGVPVVVMTFEPHPRTLFRPQSPVFRLSNESEKSALLSAIGVDGMAICEFTREFASSSADEFVERYLVQYLQAAHVVIGFNFHFGKDRVGTPEFLLEAGKNSGFGVTITEARSADIASEDSSENIISSSRIRRLLGAGKPEEAAVLLGYHWRVSGEVIKGKQLGRTLGFPTANLKLAASCHLQHGIYSVRLRRPNGELLDGVASYGRRPTVEGDGEEILETFIFDFDQEIYGEQVSVTLFNYIRGEEKFDHLDGLVVQMKKDESRAKELLAIVKPVSSLDDRLNFAHTPSKGA